MWGGLADSVGLVVVVAVRTAPSGASSGAPSSGGASLITTAFSASGRSASICGLGGFRSATVIDAVVGKSIVDSGSMVPVVAAFVGGSANMVALLVAAASASSVATSRMMPAVAVAGMQTSVQQTRTAMWIAV